MTEYYEGEASSTASRLQEENYQLLNKTDTLESLVRTKEQFIQSFKHYLGSQDSIIPEVEVPNYSLPTLSEVNNLTEPIKSSHVDRRISDVYFLPPIQGYGVTRGFDEKVNHFGVDIVAKKDEPILSIADGTVIFSSWTDETGYVLGIQHVGNITSLYKHNSVILKNVGDIVKAGDAVAIIGNSGELTSGPHLHFEMWLNGEAINPQHYISFEK